MRVERDTTEERGRGNMGMAGFGVLTRLAQGGDKCLSPRQMLAHVLPAPPPPPPHCLHVANSRLPSFLRASTRCPYRWVYRLLTVHVGIPVWASPNVLFYVYSKYPCPSHLPIPGPNTGWPDKMRGKQMEDTKETRIGQVSWWETDVPPLPWHCVQGLPLPASLLHICLPN